MKKDETRFTIRFNPADPRHQRAVEALEKAGRRKASLIADAICEYLARHEEYGAADIFLPAPFPAATSIMSNAPTSEAAVNDSPMQKSLTDARVHTETDTIASFENANLDSDLHDAVLSGLSAFKVSVK